MLLKWLCEFEELFGLLLFECMLWWVVLMVYGDVLFECIGCVLIDMCGVVFVFDVLCIGVGCLVLIGLLLNMVL